MTGINERKQDTFWIEEKHYFHRDKIDTTSSLNYLVCSALLCL